MNCKLCMGRDYDIKECAHCKYAAFGNFCKDCSETYHICEGCGQKIKKVIIYKFCNFNKEFLYVGQTTNLPRRLLLHSKDKSWWREVNSVYFAEIPYNNGNSKDIYEIYYINDTKAKYNVKDINIDFKSFELPLLSFKELETFKTVIQKEREKDEVRRFNKE